MELVVVKVRDWAEQDISPLSVFQKICDEEFCKFVKSSLYEQTIKDRNVVKEAGSLRSAFQELILKSRGVEIPSERGRSCKSLLQKFACRDWHLVEKLAWKIKQDLQHVKNRQKIGSYQIKWTKVIKNSIVVAKARSASQDDVEECASAEPRTAICLESKVKDFLETIWSGYRPDNQGWNSYIKWEIASAILRKHQASCISAEFLKIHAQPYLLKKVY